MRRNSSYKQAFLGFLLFIGLYTYESAASMQIWLPPLMGVCLGLFIRFDKEDNFYASLAILAWIMLIESQNNLPMGMVLGLYTGLYLFAIPRLQTLLTTSRITWVIYVFLAYSGFYILAFIIDTFMGSAIAPSIWIILYFITFESIIAMFLS